MKNNKKFKLVILDMDGVILKSDLLYFEIAKKINSKVNLTEISNNISKGGQALFKSIFGDNYTEDNVIWFREMQIKVFNPNIHLYNDIVKIIMDISRNYKLAMVSNKPVYCIEGILKHVCVYDEFDVVVGRDSGLAIKPNPDGINHVLHTMKVDKNEALYLGDSKSDYDACSKADIAFAHCKYGFDTSSVKCEYILNEVNQINGILEL
tara:strand:- start:288 stop:911 length:624 start_codon:yes stop_codon:yes gene_type:complete